MVGIVGGGEEKMMKFLCILFVMSVVCGVVVLVGVGWVVMFDIVFVNFGKIGEVYWDMVVQIMQVVGCKFNVCVEVLISECNYCIMQEFGFGVLVCYDKFDFLILFNEEFVVVLIIEVVEVVGVKMLLFLNMLIGEDVICLGLFCQKLKIWFGDIMFDLQMVGV